MTTPTNIQLINDIYAQTVVLGDTSDFAPRSHNYRDARYYEMPDDNIPSEKYRNTGIPRYFVTSLTVNNFCKNPTVRIVCCALADSLSHNCVLTTLYVNFLRLDVVVMLLAFMLEF